MKTFLQYILEAKFEAGGEDLGKLFGPRGKFSPKSKDAPKEPTAFQRSAGRMQRGDFAKMVTGIFGPSSGDVKEPTTKPKPQSLSQQKDRAIDRLRSVLTPSEEKGKKGTPKKKKDGAVQKIGSFFNHTVGGEKTWLKSTLPKKIAIGLNDHLSRLHRGFYLENMRRPNQTEATKMAHEVVDDHFAGVQRTLKKAKFTSKSGIPVKITHFEHTRENAHGKYGPMGQAISQVDDSDPMPDGRHLVVHVDHHSITGVYNPNSDHAHARHIEKHLKAVTGHDWFHIPYNQETKVQGKKIVFHGRKSSPMLFQTSMTHRDIERGDNEGGSGGRDDDGGPDEPKPISIFCLLK